MNYLRDKRVKKRRRFPQVVIVIVVVFLGVVIFTPAYNFLGGFFHQLGLPIWRGEQGVSQLARNGGEYIQPKSLLVEENQRLHEKIDELTTQQLQLDFLKRENTELKETLGYYPSGYHTVLASVLSRPSKTPYDSLIIDVGERDGVAVGDQVLAYGVILLGSIEEVYQQTSRVAMLSSTGSEDTQEMVVAEHNMFVDVIGLGGGNFEFHVPQETPIEEGNLLLVPGSDHFIAGRIEAIVFDPRDPFQIVHARLPINIQHLTSVQVISPQSTHE